MYLESVYKIYNTIKKTKKEKSIRRKIFKDDPMPTRYNISAEIYRLKVTESGQ